MIGANQSKPLSPYFAQGRLEEAEKYLMQALEQAKLGFGEHDQHVASSYQNLVRLGN